MGVLTAATVAFVGQVQRMVRVHQEGDRVSAHRHEVRYKERSLLGISQIEILEIENIIIQNININYVNGFYLYGRKSLDYLAV
ncbi:TPA: phage virion morphogenesis protein [Yersinia enterocolitica]|nr:phage virion morphogenesis protein [Yersinia enterocolitica]